MVRGVSLASPLLEMWLHIHLYTSLITNWLSQLPPFLESK